MNSHVRGAVVLLTVLAGRVSAQQLRGSVIDSALWIDTVARALNDIEFQYVGVDTLVEPLRPGGHIAFRRMANGLVLIDRWGLRLVGTVQDEKRPMICGQKACPVFFVVRETGGELASARWSDGSTWHASLGRLRARVMTARGTPAVSVTLRLVNSDYRATTDSAGRLEIANLLPGPYAAVVDDPQADPVPLTYATSLRFVAARDSVVAVTLTLPDEKMTAVEVCVADQKAMERFVRDAPTTVTGQTAWAVVHFATSDSKPVAGLHWTIAERSGASTTSNPVDGLTGRDGLTSYCRFDASASVQVEAYETGNATRVMNATVKAPARLIQFPWKP